MYSIYPAGPWGMNADLENYIINGNTYMFSGGVYVIDSNGNTSFSDTSFGQSDWGNAVWGNGDDDRF